MDTAPTKQDNTTDKKPKKSSCLKGLIIIAVLATLLFVGAKFVYLAEYQNSLATKETKSPIPTEAFVTKTKSTATPKPKKEVASQDEEGTPAEESRAAQTSVNSNNDIIDYFIETAVQDVSKREMFITRWTASNISVGVGEGTFNDSLNSCLSNFISDFNSQSNSTKLNRDDTVALGVPNIKIYYWPEDQFRQRAGDIKYGFTEWNHKSDKSLQRSMLFLSEDVMTADEAVRCQIVRHEMMHAVGFWGHSNKFFEGIMAQPKTRYIYPEEDKQLVRMLYNSGIQLGTTTADAKAYLEKNNW